jgi:DNA-binding response OmpR family regulator
MEEVMSNERNKILVIEDTKEHLMALAIKLRAHNFDVVSAGDGVTALTVVKRENPDAIILDLGLPGGDGFVILQRLKSLAGTVGIPVIVVSARPPDTNRALALKEGAVAFLQKPVKTEELLSALWKALSMTPAPLG